MTKGQLIYGIEKILASSGEYINSLYDILPQDYVSRYQDNEIMLIRQAAGELATDSLLGRLNKDMEPFFMVTIGEKQSGGPDDTSITDRLIEGYREGTILNNNTEVPVLCNSRCACTGEAGGDRSGSDGRCDAAAAIQTYMLENGTPVNVYEYTYMFDGYMVTMRRKCREDEQAPFSMSYCTEEIPEQYRHMFML